MTLISTLQIIAGLGLVGALWLYQRQKRQRASDPKCPVCRSRRLDDIVDDDMGPAVLGDDFRCRDCGLAYDGLDDELRPRVDVLVELQQLELPVLQSRHNFFKRLLFLQNSSGSQATGTRHDMVGVWEQIDQTREEYSEVFGAELPQSNRGKTAGEVLTESLQEEDSGGILASASHFLPGLRPVAESYRAERTLEQIREAVAADIDRRRAA